MATNLTDVTYRLREFWPAPPAAETVEEAGTLCRALRMGPTSQIGGNLYWTGDGDGQLALRTQGSGNVGSDKSFAFSNAKTEGGERPVVKAARYFSFFTMDADELEMTFQADASFEGGMRRLMGTLMFTQRNYFRSKSIYYWHDGRGGCAALSAASGTGTTITLANPDMVRAFEVGDVIVAYDPATYAATNIGTPATPRGAPDTVTVTGRDEQAGTLELDANFSTITSGAASDIIGHRAWIPTSGNLGVHGLYGVRTYVAFNTAEQSVTALGVNRANDPGRIAGRLEVLPANTPSSEVLRQLNALAARYQIRYDVVYAPTLEWADLSREFETAREVPPDLRRGVFGYAGFETVRPDGGKATITTDPYLWDLTSNDRIYVALQMSNWGHVTTESSIGWRTRGRPSGNNGLIDTDGQGNLSAQYGSVGQLVCRDPSKAIVIRIPNS